MGSEEMVTEQSTDIPIDAGEFIESLEATIGAQAVEIARLRYAVAHFSNGATEPAEAVENDT